MSSIPHIVRRARCSRVILLGLIACTLAWWTSPLPAAEVPLQAGGEAFVDDVTLQRSVPPPVEAYLRYPNYRGYLPDDRSQRIQVWLRVNETEAVERVQVEVMNLATGEQVLAASVADGTGEGVIQFDASNWPLGRYAVRARLGSYEYPAYLVQKISAKQRDQFDVWFDEHNVLHLRSKPVFPLRLYNTVREFAVVDDAEIGRLDKMLEAPINFNLNYTWCPRFSISRASCDALIHCIRPTA